MTTTDLSPIGLQETPEGMTPCAVCGIPTTGPTTRYPTFGRITETATGSERAAEMPRGAGIDLPTCADCRDIQTTAAAIIAHHGPVRGAHGSVAVWQTTAALYGLSVIGQTLPGPGIAHNRLSDLVHRMSAPGASAMFSRRFSPVWLSGASPKHSARTRWSAVDPEAVTECRRAAVDWFADARPPRALAHPAGKRCAWCGASTSMGRRHSEAWFGDYCCTCGAVRESGDFQDAVLQAIDPGRVIRGRTPERPTITGLVPWSQSQRGDGTPWSHLGGVEALRRDVAGLLGIAL